MPTRVAVVAGCNYTPAPAAPPTADGTHPPALQFAEADAQAMADLLQAQDFAVTLLLGSAATRAAIITALRTQSRLARAADALLLFYFAGHGGPDPDAPNRAYLIPADADPADLPTTALELENLAQHQVAAARTLTLLDCCYSGAILSVDASAPRPAGTPGPDRGSARPADPAAVNQEFGRRVRDSFRLQPGRIIITACAGDEKARELAHLQHGVFTYYVLAHWRDDPGEVTDLTLVQYVDAELEKARLPRLVRGVTDQGRLVLRAPRPSVFTVPYPRNPLFVGRADVLADLAARLGGPRTPVLAGLGGQGKTQIAVELAYRLRERYPGGVFWLTMDSDGGVRSQVAAFAGPTVLALPGHDTLTFDERVATVRHAWEESVLRLLIFDNLEDSALLHWRPRVGGSHVLVTSRNAEWSALDGVDLLLLDALPRPLSVDLLLTPRARRRQTTVPALLATAGAASAADTICEALADLPLALTLAAAHLEQRDRHSVARYAEQLQQQPVADESLNAEFKGQLPTGHEPGILATFALGYDQLDPTQATHTLALTILHRAAHAAAAPIPADLLVRLADRDPADEDAADAVDQAVQRLAALGLIERLPDASARLHRLLAAYTRHRAPDPADDADALESALITAAEQLWEAGYPQAAQPYLPHLRAAATAATRTGPPAATLLNNLAGLLQAQGDYAAARLLFERALAIREQALGPSHPDTATSLNNLADLLRAQGDYGAARPFFERALAIDEAAYGPTHPDVATDLNNLAILLQDMGDYAAARLLYKRALTIREQVLGSSHPYTATSLNNLAGLLRMQKDYGAARPLYERALTIREQALGPTHPDTAQSLNNLGLLLQDIRNYAAARPFLERALAIYEQTLGATHPDTATSLNNLAALLQTHGDYAAARPLYERALAINEAVYGPRHPAVAISLNNLAGLLQDQNDRNTARALYERALAMAEQTLGPTHPTTQAIRQNLRNL